MKKRKLRMILLMLVLTVFMLSGCGKTVEETVQEGNNVSETEDIEGTQETEDVETEEEKEAGVNNADLDDTKEVNAGDDGRGQEEKSFSDAAEELQGMVQSIDGDSVVISRIFSEESEEDGVYYAFSPGEGSDEEELITVSVTGETKYRVRTIKNGGEDVTEREGEFADIKKDYIVRVTGKMDDSRKEIEASEIVVMEIL